MVFIIDVTFCEIAVNGFDIKIHAIFFISLKNAANEHHYIWSQDKASRDSHLGPYAQFCRFSERNLLGIREPPPLFTKKITYSLDHSLLPIYAPQTRPL